METGGHGKTGRRRQGGEGPGGSSAALGGLHFPAVRKVGFCAVVMADQNAAHRKSAATDLRRPVIWSDLGETMERT